VERLKECIITNRERPKRRNNMYLRSKYIKIRIHKKYLSEKISVIENNIENIYRTSLEIKGISMF